MACSSPVLPLGSREEGADAVTCEKIADVLTVSMACLCQYGVSLARLHFRVRQVSAAEELVCPTPRLPLYPTDEATCCISGHRET